MTKQADSLTDTQLSLLRIAARDVTRLTSHLDDDTLDDLFAAASLERQRRDVAKYENQRAVEVEAHRAAHVASYSGPMGSLANQQRGDQ